MVGASICVSAALQVAIPRLSDLIKPPPALCLSPSVFVLSRGSGAAAAETHPDSRARQPAQARCFFGFIPAADGSSFQPLVRARAAENQGGGTAGSGISPCPPGMSSVAFFIGTQWGKEKELHVWGGWECSYRTRGGA